MSLPVSTPAVMSNAVVRSTQPTPSGMASVRSISEKNTAGYISEVTRAISRMVSASKKKRTSPVEMRSAMNPSASEYSQNASPVSAVTTMREMPYLEDTNVFNA